MAFTDASAYLTQFQTQLAACAVWSGGSSTIHYPNVNFTGATLPCIVVIEDQRGSDQYAAGASGLRSGTLRAILYSTASNGVIEAMAGTLVEQMLAQQSGIPFRSGSHQPAGIAEEAKAATGTSVNGVEIAFEYGLVG